MMGTLAILECKSRDIRRLAEKFRNDESGATAIEYGLIVSLIFLAVVASINAFATSTNDMYDDIRSALD